MANEKQWRRFCIAFVACCAVAVVGTSLLNWTIDPYAQYGTGLVPPIVQTSRAEKVELLDRQSTPPMGLILGSSRVMKLEPDYLSQLTGYRYFNAGVNFGKPEDYLALLRWYHARFDRWPAHVVVGLDVAAFAAHPPLDARLAGDRRLAAQIPEAIDAGTRMTPIKELLSWQQTSHSVKSVFQTFGGLTPALPQETLRDDGLRIYNQREAEIASGTYDFESALAYTQDEYARLYHRFETLDLPRLRHFARFVRTCLDHDIALHVFLTPLHPELIEYLDKGDPNRAHFRQRRRETLQFLELALSRRGIPWRDFTEIDAFDGSDKYFVDGIHPLEPNTRRMLNRLIEASPSDTVAVQPNQELRQPGGQHAI